MKVRKRILVAPLNWGIGHATRCIPIINALIDNNYEVIIAAEGRPLHLLSTEFPQLEIIRFADYNITYPKYLPMSVSMLLQIPKILWNIKKEHTTLQSIIKDYNIDGVISDNRFGLYSDDIPCVFITHQLQIQSPYFNENIRDFNYNYINKYNACWVMDNERNNLAGRLSMPETLPNKTIYIGTQSRFKKEESKKKYDFMALISGPEPQRTILEKGLINALKIRKERALIVLGKPEEDTKKELGNLTILSHLNAKDLNAAILQSELIICRPGYSTVMDLTKLEKNAIFIPTPGQTEQEYLANHFLENNICFAQKQSEFNFELAVNESKKYPGLTSNQDYTNNWKELFALF